MCKADDNKCVVDDLPMVAEAEIVSVTNVVVECGCARVLVCV